MAVNIFDKYGIKEVANVQFEALEDDLAAGVYKGDIVLFLDTLKVSTIETTAEESFAQGGWGNPRLVQWDYGKEITVTLEDALMSLESLRFMLGGAIHRTDKQETVVVRHNEEVVCGVNGVVPFPVDHITKLSFDGTKLPIPTATYEHPIRLINLTKGTRTQIVVASASGDPIAMDDTKPITFFNPKLIGTENYKQTTEQGDHIRIFWDEVITGAQTDKETAIEVTISPSTYPGTYRIVGDTFMRSQATGADEAFQFIINKAKVTSEVTLTLEAEGDPTTFEMTLNVLRASNERGEDEMMKLVRYGIISGADVSGGNDYGSIGTGSDG